MMVWPEPTGRVVSEAELRQAEHVARQQKSGPALIEVLGELAKLYRGTGKPDRAPELVREAADVARRRHHPEL